MNMFRAFVTISVLAFAGAAQAETTVAPTAGGPIVMRRLTAEQYRQTIDDIFGRTIVLGGRFEPEQRVGGLLALGSGRVSVAAAGLEQYDSIARSVAAQVVAPNRRDTLIPCTPASATAPDPACAREFFKAAGKLLYRRPLSDAEVQTWVGVSNASTTQLKDFYAGLATGLTDIMLSAPFLFRLEQAMPDPARRGALRTDAYTTASRLSFFLWNTSPDAELLQAAENGQLNTKAGLARQVDRLLSSPRLEAGVRAFFSDMLGFEEFDTLNKDHTAYPKFTGQAVKDAREQTLRTLVSLLLEDHADYRDIFTTRKTFLTPTLGALYGVPVARLASAGAPDLWVAHEFPEGDPHTGILTHASFVALHSHPGRSSPTLRGKALREIMLCQKVPNPPNNIDFAIAQDTVNPVYKTARKRLTAHRSEAMCAGCHKLVDPLGLSLETFDSAAGLRGEENGETIDTSGELDGKTFADAAGLGLAVRSNPAVTSCLANRMYNYAVGRAAAAGEKDWINSLQQGFASDGYRLPELMRRIALSDAMVAVAAPPEQVASVKENK